MSAIGCSRGARKTLLEGAGALSGRWVFEIGRLGSSCHGNKRIRLVTSAGSQPGR